MDIKKPQLVKVEAFAIFFEDSSATPSTLRDMHLPQGQLVMMIKRGNRYIVPNGTRKLLPGDRLLVIYEE